MPEKFKPNQEKGQDNLRDTLGDSIEEYRDQKMKAMTDYEKKYSALSEKTKHLRNVVAELARKCPKRGIADRMWDIYRALDKLEETDLNTAKESTDKLCKEKPAVWSSRDFQAAYDMIEAELKKEQLA